MTITMQEMLEAGLHFGHQTRYWHPKMASYIFGVRHKIHIINLDKTLPLFQEALKFVRNVAAKKGKILFVGTKPAAQDVVRAEAERCGMPYVSYRWLGGMLTNYKTVRQSIKRLRELEELRNGPTADRLTKKEVLLLGREIARLEKSLGGVRKMGGLPDAVFVIDIGHEKIAISEARKLKIPVIGVVDSNCSPDGIDYLIPGNDDAVKSIKFYAQNIADEIMAARASLAEEGGVAEEEAAAKKEWQKGAGTKEHGRVVTRRRRDEVVVEEEREGLLAQDFGGAVEGDEGGERGGDSRGKQKDSKGIVLANKGVVGAKNKGSATKSAPRGKDQQKDFGNKVPASKVVKVVVKAKQE